MVTSKVFEHSKRYLVDIQFYNYERLTDNPQDAVQFLATRFEIKAANASIPINQKGKDISSAFRSQPTIHCDLRVLMQEPSFNTLILESVRNASAIIVRVRSYEKVGSRLYNSDTGVGFLFDGETGRLETLMFECIGYIESANIVGETGEFIIANLSILCDDIGEFDPNNLPEELITFN